LNPSASTNRTQSQEQVHTVAARVRTSVNRACVISQDALTGAQTSPKALGNLLCNVNIVWFRVHIRLPVNMAVSTSTLMMKFFRIIVRFERAYNVTIMANLLVLRKSLDLLAHSHSGTLSVYHTSQDVVTPACIKNLRLHLLLLTHQLSEAGRCRFTILSPLSIFARS
jgi:hypothetical protein